MALPINIDELLHGNTVEWDRIELKKGGILRISFTLYVHTPMISTIGMEVISSLVLKKKMEKPNYRLLVYRFKSWMPSRKN